MTTTNKPYNSDERRIINLWKEKHAKAVKEGNFGYANYLKMVLESQGIDGDFETIYDPEPLRS